MDFPKNCLECEHGRTCKAWHYGGDRCSYKEEINRALVEQMRCTKEET